MNCWQDWSYFVGFVDLFSILQWQKSTNAAGCEYRAWIMWIWKMRLMHILFTSILPIFVCTVGHFQSEFSFATVTVFQIGVWRPNRYHFLWQNVHVFQLGFFANTSANHFSAVESARPSSPTTPPPPHANAAAAAAAAAASAETRACRDGVPGVYEDLRLLIPAVLRRLVRECTSLNSHFNWTPHALARRVQTQATSLSLTEYSDVSVGILLHHSAAPLGQSMYIIYLP